MNDFFSSKVIISGSDEKIRNFYDTLRMAMGCYDQTLEGLCVYLEDHAPQGCPAHVPLDGVITEIRIKSMFEIELSILTKNIQQLAAVWLFAKTVEADLDLEYFSRCTAHNLTYSSDYRGRYAYATANSTALDKPTWLESARRQGFVSVDRFYDVVSPYVTDCSSFTKEAAEFAETMLNVNCNRCAVGYGWDKMIAEFLEVG